MTIIDDHLPVIWPGLHRGLPSGFWFKETMIMSFIAALVFLLLFSLFDGAYACTRL